MVRGFTDAKGKFRPTGREEFGIPRRSTKRRSVQTGVGRKQEIQMARIQKRFPNDPPQPDPVGNLSSTEVMLAQKEVDSEIDNVGFDDNLFEFENGNEWWIFTKEDDARQRAVQQETDLLETEESIASDLALRFPEEEFVFITDIDRRLLAQDLVDSLRESSEDDAEKLAREQLEDDFAEFGLTEKDVDEESDKFEEELEKIKERRLDELESNEIDNIELRLKEDPIEYLVNEQGLFSKEDLLKQNFIRTDIDKMAEFVIDSDGVANTLAGFDGNEIVVNDKDGKERLYMYRAN